MKKRLIFAGILLAAAMLSGCAEETQEQEAETETVEAEAEPPAPGEENWGTAPEVSVPMITTTPIRSLCVTVGSTEEEVSLTWYSPSEEAGQVLWTTAEDENFAQADAYSASSAPSSVTSGYYINRATVTGLLPETEYQYQVGSGDMVSPVYAHTTPFLIPSALRLWETLRSESRWKRWTNRRTAGTDC